MTAPTSFFEPDWPEQNRVSSYCTTRYGGVSAGEYATLNIASHVGDDINNVENNRLRLRESLKLPAEPLWLEQIHSNRVARIEAFTEEVSYPADAAYTRVAGKVLTVMVADCLPILLASAGGGEVAAVHAGWRGMATGVITEACSLFRQQSSVIAWLGPAIGACHYEVGAEVRDSFTPREALFFRTGRDKNHWWMDLYGLARLQLKENGVSQVYGGGFCTYHQADRFYSYRRDDTTGRFGVFIWIGDK